MSVALQAVASALTTGGPLAGVTMQEGQARIRTADVASVLTDFSAGGTIGLCSQNTIGSAVGSAECGS